MKNLMIFSTLAIMVVINFSGCGKAQERPSKPNKAIATQVVAIDGLVDITKDEHQNSPENIAFKKQLIAKIDDVDKRTYAEGLLAQNRLVYMLMNKKALVLEFIPATQNKHISMKTEITSSATAVSATTEVVSATATVSDVVLYTFDALIAMKNGQAMANEWSKPVAQNQFAILSEIEIQTGILENEKTDYDEKKSTLTLTETSLEQAQFLILKSELKSEIKASASDDAQK
ncbi:hypothetical protein CIK05_11635 [Bdellovibrio sp. qaytius]|nr:hypothetical protein CIK05_11635 [Bdellovibrio sp. qaytius]